MLGTIVNALAIILGSLVGILIKRGIKEEYKKTIMDGIGLSVIIIGIMGGIGSQNIIVVIASIVLGGIVGELLKIEDKLNNLGNSLQNKFNSKDGNFARNLLTGEVINEMSAVGGILIMAIGINLLEIRKIRVGTMLPAIFMPIFFYIITNLDKIIR